MDARLRLGGHRPLLWPTVGTIVFVLFVGPGPVIGVVPFLLSGWRLEAPLLGWAATRWLGVALFVLGVPLLGDAIVRFVRTGRGTPAPIAPTEVLVVVGPYRYVRNPMYIGVVSMIAGQGLFFGNLTILVYAACAALAFHLFVVLYEEPALRRRFGDQYGPYCSQVNRWIPRLTPAESR